MKSTGLKVSDKTLRTAISRYYDFEQKKIFQSILDIEGVFVRIMNTKNEIKSNILRAQGGAGIETFIKLKNRNDTSIRDALLDELIPFQDNNKATLEKAKQFLEINLVLIEQVKTEIAKPRIRRHLE